MADTVAGFIGGIVSIYVGLPLDVVKVRVQTKGYLFKNAMDCAYHTVRNEGVLAFWKGAMPALATGIIENAVVFSANGVLHRLFCETEETPTFRKLCFLNGGSAVFSGFCITPSEVIKCRLQTCLGHGEDSHVYRVLSDLFKSEGVPGLFRGLGATWARDVPFYIVFFGSYSYYKLFMLNTFYKNNYDITPDKMPSWNYIVGGGVSGSIGWATIFPLDHIKSRQQTNTAKISFIETTKTILKNGGIKALYKGCWPCIIRGFPANGALFLTVEYTKKVFDHFGFKSGSSLGSKQSL